MPIWEIIHTASPTTIIIICLILLINRIVHVVHDLLDSRQFRRSSPSQRRDLIEYRRARNPRKELGRE